jgi:hypothetical protein
LATSVRSRGLAFHTVFRVPRPLLFPHINDLSNVVGIVRADVREPLRLLFQFFLVSGFHPLFELHHYFVKLLYRLIPTLTVPLIERLVIVTAEFVQLLSLASQKSLPNGPLLSGELSMPAKNLMGRSSTDLLELQYTHPITQKCQKCPPKLILFLTLQREPFKTKSRL